MTTVLERELIAPDTSLQLQNASSINPDNLDARGWLIRQPNETSNATNFEPVIISDSNNNPVAYVQVQAAEDSSFQTLTKLPKGALKTCAFITNIWVSPSASIAEVLPTILYFALSKGRVMGRQNITALLPIPNPNAPIATLLHLDRLENVGEISSGGMQYLAVCQRIAYAAINAYKQCSGDAVALINHHLVNELTDHVYRWIAQFNEGAWATAIVNKTIAKEQYIRSLFNLHEYVRWTTRLASRAIAHAADPDIRNHFINHMRGEINHEIMIERDLKYLGADLNYLQHEHLPDPATKEFMVVQESTIGFYQDSFLFLACPLAAEGIAAHIKPEFLQALEDCIRSWGYDQPKEAMRFLSSHVNTDGGDDGHWLMVVNTIKRNLTSEYELQRFMSVLTAAMNGFEHGFNASIEDFSIWSAKPE